MSGETFRLDPFTDLVPRYLTPLEPPTSFICRRLYVPNEPNFKAAIAELLSRVGFADIWEQSAGGLETWQAAAIGAAMYEQFTRSYCMIGAVLATALGTLPDYMLDCDGQTYSRVDYPELYAALDAAYITDADNFTVPDLRGRAAIGTGAGEDLTARTMGEASGEEAHVLTVAELAEHDHTSPEHGHSDTGHVHSEVTAVSVLINGGLEAPATAAIPFTSLTGAGYASITNTSVSIDATGESEAHNNMPPFVALRYVIIAK